MKDLLAESKVWFNALLDVKDKAITGCPAAKNDLPAESKVLFEFTVDHKDFKEFTRGYCQKTPHVIPKGALPAPSFSGCRPSTTA